MKTARYVFILFILGIVIIGCDTGTSPKPGSTLVTISQSNLSGTKAVFITGSSGGRGFGRASSDDYESLKFYKVGVDDQTQTVNFTDNEGVTVPAVTDYVQNLSSKYAVMRVYTEEAPWQKCVFIIRKADGKLFTTPDTLANSGTDFGSDPLGKFTWDGGGNEGIDYTRHIKTNAAGDVYYTGGGYTLGGTLYRIHEKNGSTTITTVGNVTEYYQFNNAGDVYAGAVDGGGGNVTGLWIKADGRRFTTPWFVNEGPETPAVTAGSPFALACSPDSFFTIDQMYDGFVWKKSVLSEYRVQDGDVVRTVVHEFSKRMSHFSVLVSSAGIGLPAVDTGNEICIIKAPDDITYHTISAGSQFINGDFIAALSDRYVYAFNPNILLTNHNRISRLDPETKTETADYYTVPPSYTLEWVWVSHGDVLTILAGKDGSETIYIEVDAAGNESIYDNYGGEKVVHRSAF
ncbi:hypothetical protein [Breznakiella homolactica]|uniref:Lipoprotein n=1 Tax=Breznakiella homolactica TaxID=2798577 RepID=A0A7T8B8J7_9SPIR|nr:hypothetical protein [Breznakiella homolactica]QQO08674.1 hypothetical protein JFL75_17355 [Breznakiella homolactica]